MAGAKMLLNTHDCMGHVFTCTLNALSSTSVAAQAIFINDKESLRWERAHDILSQEESYLQCVVPPERPKSGKVFQLTVIYWPIDLSYI